MRERWLAQALLFAFGLLGERALAVAAAENEAPVAVHADAAPSGADGGELHRRDVVVGIKFLSPNFEWASMFCGVVFSVTCLWMLIGLLRTPLFAEVIWSSDKDKSERFAARRGAHARTAKGITEARRAGSERRVARAIRGRDAVVSVVQTLDVLRVRARDLAAAQLVRGREQAVARRPRRVQHGHRHDPVIARRVAQHVLAAPQQRVLDGLARGR